MPADQERDYQDALQTVERTLANVQSAEPHEREELVREWNSLADMARKLEAGRVDIAVFGEVSSGKSALINALVGEYVADVNVRGGWTKEVWRVGWGVPHTIRGLGSSELVLIDTPGINEVDDEGRAVLALEAGRAADLILFVTDADLNAREFEALAGLAAANKPMILVFNKKDLYTPDQRARIMEVLRQERLPHVIGPDDIVMTAADPLEREVIFESADGSTRTEWRKPKPDVEQLKIRILEVLDREGKSLIALNASLYAADTSDRLASVKVRLRDKHANRAIWTFVVAKSIAVASKSGSHPRRRRRSDYRHHDGGHAGRYLWAANVAPERQPSDHGDPLVRWLGDARGVDHAPGRECHESDVLRRRDGGDRAAPGTRSGLRIVHCGASRQVLPRARCVVGRCRPEERRAPHSGNRREGFRHWRNCATRSRGRSTRTRSR